ncbi:glycosyl hydrolase [Pseudomonas capeferrum]|uniref:WD40/YVTN/BNR-like repeat-containing protein n=1 Tax=Pseudomonas capeferrum TaxID=1495066 RepID=UPI0015E3C3AC|nr:YCF48-related protein [Pseudomonas capeferrum]MBA1204331.1 glycosyl hydrolase [Pseudomonas capeferrum]
MISQGLARPKSSSTRLLSVALIPLWLAMTGTGQAATSTSDTLDLPAQTLGQPLAAPLISVASAGNVLVGVGLHGLIQRSSDNGSSWEQVPSPVSSDFVQVRFSDARNGWIVGHDSVVLHSSDGGATWAVQMDGRKLLSLLGSVYGKRAEQGDPQASDLVQEVNRAVGTSATPDVLPAPLLDVLFDASGRGFAVGAFGMILYSEDAGSTWQPWLERADNPRRMHLYGLAERNGTFYISGEQGVLLRLEPGQQRFEKIDTPYTGTYFGIGAFEHLLLAYGLRGNLFASVDGGQQWQRLETGVDGSLVSIVEQGPALVVVSQGGQLVSVDRHSLKVTPLAQTRVGEVYAASATEQAGRLVVARFAGAKVIDIARAN